MGRFFSSKYFHWLYDLSIIIKGIDGVFECLGGITLLFLSKTKLDSLTSFLLRHELAQDPTDLFANSLLSFVHRLPEGTKIFGAVYLMAHGALKIFLVYNLLRERLWAFPIGIGVLWAFILYQTSRLILHFSYGLLIVTVFDILVLWFVWNEYKVVLRKKGV